MRVMLIIPTYRYQQAYPVPLCWVDCPTGPPYLAAALMAAGHQVYGLNMNNKPQYASAQEMMAIELERAIGEFHPELIATGGICVDYSFVRDAIPHIRRLTKAPVVLGGRMITYDREYIDGRLHPNYAVSGDAERQLVALAGGAIPGDDGGIDCLPFPNYDVFGGEEMLANSKYVRRQYRYIHNASPRTASIITARGCPFGCTFCINNNKQRYRPRSLENVSMELEWRWAHYEPNIFVMLDELFAAKDEHVSKFSRMVIEGREKGRWGYFNWCFQTHASSHLTLETLTLAKEAGLYFLAYGLESSSPTILKSMRKHTKPEWIADIAIKAEAAKIGLNGNYLEGDPATTIATVKEDFRFFNRHLRDCNITFAYPSPYPGSKLYDLCLERGLIRDKEWYYDNLDCQIINMTSIPDRVWKPWIYAFAVVSSKYLWVKRGKSLKCGWCQCPHCGVPNYVAEELPPPPKWVARHSLAYRAKLLLSVLWGWPWPLFPQLMSFMGMPGDYIVTACANCGKTMRAKKVVPR